MTIPGKEFPTESKEQLQCGTVLNGTYRLDDVLGLGGFEITYLGWDLTLSRKLVVKEYFPLGLCSREKDGTIVQPSLNRRHSFDLGLKRFMEEGQALPRFRGVVSPIDSFRANGTAYLVTEYLEGLRLREYLNHRGGKVPFDLAVRILNPVMDTLREVHAADLVCRIDPSIIYITRVGQVKLLPLESACSVALDGTTNRTMIVKEGYAPMEQWMSRRMGPWTDVYAVAAIFYRAITGREPQPAFGRLARDEVEPPSRIGVTISAVSEAALLKGLAIRPENRFQTIAEFQNAILRGQTTVSTKVHFLQARLRELYKWIKLEAM